MTQKRISALRRRSSPIAFKSTVLWRGEDRSLFGGAILGEDIGTMIGNGVVVG